MSAVAISSSGGVVLEGRWDLAPDPVSCLVLCHPHPLHGGTMLAPLLVTVTSRLVERGISVLRFNFRGVGTSTGEHDFGNAEQDDVAAAVALAREEHPRLDLAVGGWSFGAATALRWQASTGSTLAYAGIAPPVLRERYPGLPGAGDLAAARRTIIIGDRDQFSPLHAAERYADAIGATLTVLKGSDHFFYFREERVAALIETAIGVPTEV
jgi:alpha/beta superfamily hydrolase